MPVTRRSFLKSGATSVLTTVIALGQYAPAHGQDKSRTESKPGPTRTIDELPVDVVEEPAFTFHAENFRPYVGGIFVARAGRNSIEMTLAAVRDCSPKPTSKLTTAPAPKTECFALDFVSASAESLTDLTSIYDIEHAALGAFPLFMTRRDGTDGKTRYEAVFNYVH